MVAYAGMVAYACNYSVQRRPELVSLGVQVLAFSLSLSPSLLPPLWDSLSTSGTHNLRSLLQRSHHHWYLVAKVAEVQREGGGAVSPLHHVAQVGLVPTPSPADIFEVVKKLPSFHQKAVNESRNSGHTSLSPCPSFDFIIIIIYCY